MPQKNLAQNETLEIVLDGEQNGAVAAQTGPSTHASCTVVVEVTATDTDTWITPVRLRDPVAGAEVTQLLGPSKSGWADVPGFKRVRVRRTDANGGNGLTYLNARPG